jgi:hypothetical protein
MRRNYQDDAVLIFSNMYHKWRRPNYDVFLKKVGKLMKRYGVEHEKDAVMGILMDIKDRIVEE